MAEAYKVVAKVRHYDYAGLNVEDDVQEFDNFTDALAELIISIQDGVKVTFTYNPKKEGKK